MEKNEILKLLESKMPYLQEKYAVSSLALFGSYSRGDQQEGSDIDILVDFLKPVSLFLLTYLEDYLSELLSQKVDLVPKNSLKERLRPIILKECINVPT